MKCIRKEEGRKGRKDKWKETGIIKEGGNVWNAKGEEGRREGEKDGGKDR